MKKKIIFCLLSLSLMIAGCQSNEIEDITPPSKEVQLSPEELLSIRYKSSPELSQTEVFNLLTTFQSSELKNNAHSRITFQPNIFQIKEKYYLSKNKADARNIESTEGTKYLSNKIRIHNQKQAQEWLLFREIEEPHTSLHI